LFRAGRGMLGRPCRHAPGRPGRRKTRARDPQPRRPGSPPQRAKGSKDIVGVLQVLPRQAWLRALLSRAADDEPAGESAAARALLVSDATERAGRARTVRRSGPPGT